MTSCVTCLGAGDANSGVTGSKWICLYCQVLFIALCQADFEMQNQHNPPKSLRKKGRVAGRGCWMQLSSVSGGNVQWDPCCAKSFSIISHKHTQALCTVPSTANSSHSKLHLGTHAGTVHCAIHCQQQSFQAPPWKATRVLECEAHDHEVRLCSLSPCDAEIN